MIRLRRISRDYRDGGQVIHALREVTLDIPERTSVALIGKSGSGKSTLLHLVGGLESPSSGELEVAGQTLTGMDDAALTRFRLRHIGFVFQFFHLLPSLTVLENLLLPAELAGLSAAQAGARAHDLLERVELADRAGAYPDRLSGGQQQRVAVARALMLNPPVLLADEPTGNLDSETGGRVMDLLWGLTREQGATLIVATHSPEVAGRANRCLELRDGRLAADVTNGAPAAAAPEGTGGAHP